MPVRRDRARLDRQLASLERGWEGRAACYRHPSLDDWFPDKTDRNNWRKAAMRAAAVCATCPVRRQCALRALANDERDGVWAGVLLEPGAAARRSQRQALRSVCRKTA